MANTILIAEDNRTVLLQLMFTLRQQGYTVLTAMNGQEAWNLLQENEIDLLITDIMMPHIDGISLLKQVRHVPTLANLPVIVLTASGETEQYQLAKNAGANEVLTKPASSLQLIELATNLLAQN